mmetsp:Transcript_36133/g.67288  ORF Transcript_36133/g.67288 Transcript_36133/m.67288 type:complete len:458 (+) Transcript_36133:77-1450(+)
MWNTKDNKKALDPGHKVEEHFVDGDTFGIHGDIVAVPKSFPKIPDEKKLPVTILTGFLGSGKTTLLNYILQEQREKKIAVIENEFGEVSIDDLLLKKDKIAFAEKVVVMDNGCMCCTIRGDLIDGFREILKEVENGKHLDQIVIETTGMADPVPIVRTFMTSEEISSRLRLDGVITVADAKNVCKRLDDEVEEGRVNEAYQQVAFCDKLLLNKLDLVSAEEAIKTKERLRDINAFAKIVPAVRGRVKMSELVNLRAHDMSNFINADIEKEAVDEPEEGHGGHGGHGEHGGHGGHDGHEGHGGHGGHGDGHDPDCKEDHGHGDHGGHGGHGESNGAHGSGHADEHGHVAKKHKSRHDSKVNSMAFVREGEVLPSKLGNLMETLGQLPPERGTIFRIKGILAVKNHPYKHVFHAVMDVSDEDDAEPWAPGEKRITKMVFIGKALDKAYIREAFDSCFEQ